MIDITHKVVSIVGGSLSKPLAEIKPELNLVQDLDMDGIGAAEICLALEAELSIKITDVESDRLFSPGATVKNLIDFVIEKRSDRSSIS